MKRPKEDPVMEALSFEQALERLEGLVGELEKGQLTLERSLQAFEEGVRLSKLLMERLQQAERRAQALVETESGEGRLEPFEEGDDEDSAL